ncbi:MAG: tetratricopeptide repeat protein [bacterium]|jgi:tetratricopeptide (TPR) repeat protein|nr:tetratricopeptide repeat protein [bacterium]
MLAKKVYALFSLVLFLVFFTIGCSQNSPDAVFNRGLRAMEERDPIGASLYFEEFIQKFPEDERFVDAHWRLVQCYNVLQDFGSARTVLEKIKTQFPDPLYQFNADFAIAKTYFDEGIYDQAITAFQEIGNSTTEPRIRIEATRWEAASYAKQTQAATAVALLENVISIAKNEINNPTQALDYQLQALANSADIYLASQEFDQARSVYTRTLDIVQSATDIVGLDRVREDAVLNWANSYFWAGDFVSSATIYDQLQDNPNILEDTKPRLIEMKISSLVRLFLSDGEEDLSPEEKAVLVHEYKRLVDNYHNTDPGINANVEIARLVKDTTPEMAESFLINAMNAYQKMIEEPSSPERPLIAMFRMADANIKMEKFEDAKQMLKRIQQTFSNVPQAMQETSKMLNYIQMLEEQKANPQTEAAEEAVNQATEDNQEPQLPQQQ